MDMKDQAAWDFDLQMPDLAVVLTLLSQVLPAMMSARKAQNWNQVRNLA